MATPQQQQSNGRPSSSSQSPPRHFFKIMLPNAIHAQKLILPEVFVQEFRDDLSSMAKLTDPNERVWQIGVEKSVEDVWFGEKWKDFVDYYSVTCGHFIVFKYEGSSSFRVLIFDHSTCEINYPCDAPTSSDQQHDLSLSPLHGEDIGTEEAVKILGSASDATTCDQDIGTEEGVKILGSDREISHPCDTPKSDQQPNHVEESLLPHHEQEIGTEEGVKITGPDCEISHPCNTPTGDQQRNHVELSSLPHNEREVGTEEGVEVLGSACEIGYLCKAPTSDQQPNNAGLSLSSPHHGGEIGTEEVVENLGSACEMSYPTSDQQLNRAELSFLYSDQEIGTKEVAEILGSDREISYPFDVPTSDQQDNHISELSLPQHGQEIGTDQEGVEILSSTSPHASLDNISREKQSVDMVRISSHEQQESLLDEARDSSSRQSKDGENAVTMHPDSGGMNIDDHQLNESASSKSAAKSDKANKRTKTGNHEEDTGTSRKRRRKTNKSQLVVRRAASEQERSDALYRARLYRSENPFFIKVIGKSNVQNPHVYVEKPFSDKHMKGPPGWLKLEVSDGRQWPVSYSYSNGEGSAKCLRKGWAAFLKENLLEEGDACVFELVRPDDIVFRVQIFRAMQESEVLTLTLD